MRGKLFKRLIVLLAALITAIAVSTSTLACFGYWIPWLPYQPKAPKSLYK
jgi:hypothetical protein